MGVRARSGHGNAVASESSSFSDKLAVVVSRDLGTFGKERDDGIKGGFLNADGKKGVVALVGEGGAWHGVDLVHVVLDVVLASGSADLSLLTNVAEVREEIVLIKFILGNTKEATKKVRA